MGKRRHSFSFHAFDHFPWVCYLLPLSFFSCFQFEEIWESSSGLQGISSVVQFLSLSTVTSCFMHFALPPQSHKTGFKLSLCFSSSLQWRPHAGQVQRCGSNHHQKLQRRIPEAEHQRRADNYGADGRPFAGASSSEGKKFDFYVLILIFFWFLLIERVSSG